MLKKFAVVRNEGLAALKKTTRKSSVAKGAMLRSWLLNQSPKLRRCGAAVSDTDIKSPHHFAVGRAPTALVFHCRHART